MTTPLKGQLSYLLIGLLVFLLIAPVINDVTASSLVNAIAFLSIIIIGIWSLVDHRRGFIIGIALALCSLILAFVNLALELSELRVLNNLVILLFCILSLVIVAQKVLFVPRIDANTLIGSACVYLLLGIIWGLLYSIVEFFFPGSFHGTGEIYSDEQLWQFIYYSFVTITTLGYGDIYPLIPFARSLAYLEAVCGQLYIALLVASLVGGYMSRKQNLE